MVRFGYGALLVCLFLSACAHTPPPAPGSPEAALGRPPTPQEKVYFAYYSRIRTKLEKSWKEAMRARREELRKASLEKNTITAFVLKLSPTGEVLETRVVAPSASIVFNEIAAEAVQKAVPFEAPPAGLVDPKTGAVEIRWDFVLKR